MKNEKKFKFSFDNLKSDYFLTKIFDYIERKKSLKIVKCNKVLQKRANISIKDYIDYCKFYSSIEIELNITYKLFDQLNTFINISNEEKNFFHIYFDNSNKEITRNFLKKNEKVKNIKIKIDYQIVSFKGLFKDCKCIKSIVFKKFYRINLIDMSFMFQDVIC